jgi:hypothetical protein
MSEIETEWHSCTFEFKVLRAGTELPDWDYSTLLRGLGRAIAFLLYADELNEDGLKSVGILVRELRLKPTVFLSDDDIANMLDRFRSDEGA